MLAVGLERDQGAGVDDPRKLRDPAGDNLRQVFVLADPHHRDNVGMAGYRIHLGDALQLDELDGQVRHPSWFGIDEDEGVDHGR